MTGSMSGNMSREADALFIVRAKNVPRVVELLEAEAENQRLRDALERIEQSLVISAREARQIAREALAGDGE